MLIQKRLDALHRIDKGESLKSIALGINVGKSTVSGWKKKRIKIQTFCLNLEKAVLKSLSILKNPKQEKLYDALLIWSNQ